jgi:hypothetical protein
MGALDGTVPSMGQILRRCTESASDWMFETGQVVVVEGRSYPAFNAVASNSPTPLLLRACLASAADAFAVVEAFVRAAAVGFDGGFAQSALVVGVFEFMFGAFKGTIPVVSLCWQADDGKSARSLYSLLASCLKLQSTQSALPARLAAAEVHATLRVCRAAVLLIQDRHWPAALLQAGDAAAETQETADSIKPSYDPVSRLPSVVLFGRCCLLWAQEIKTGLPGLLAQLAGPQGASSNSGSSSSRGGPRSLSSLQLPQHSASWVCFELAWQRVPTTASQLEMLVEMLEAFLEINAAEIAVAGCNVSELRLQLEKLLKAGQTAARSTSSVAAAVDAFVQQLLETGKACCAVPLKTLCSNPVCGVVSGPSELKLVGGVVGLCKGCLGVRYCSTACQRQHWKQHRPVCKALAERKAAAAAAAGSC